MDAFVPQVYVRTTTIGVSETDPTIDNLKRWHLNGKKMNINNLYISLYEILIRLLDKDECEKG